MSILSKIRVVASVAVSFLAIASSAHAGGCHGRGGWTGGSCPYPAPGPVYPSAPETYPSYPSYVQPAPIEYLAPSYPAYPAPSIAQQPVTPQPIAPVAPPAATNATAQPSANADALVELVRHQQELIESLARAVDRIEKSRQPEFPPTQTSNDTELNELLRDVRERFESTR